MVYHLCLILPAEAASVVVHLHLFYFFNFNISIWSFVSTEWTMALLISYAFQV